MDDLVDRMRRYSVGAHDGPALHPAICDEAADEIERLRAALQRIADWCPATQEMTLAHQMADEAQAALTPALGRD